MKKLILLILFIPSIGIAQSVSFAPTSFQAWGVTPSVSSVTVEYNGFGVRTIIPYMIETDKHHKKTRFLLGLSYKAELIEKILRAGAIMFNRPFPTSSGQRFNLIVDIGYSFSGVRISYVHISNGYTNDFNPGVDFLQLSLDI